MQYQCIGMVWLGEEVRVDVGVLDHYQTYIGCGWLTRYKIIGFKYE